MKRQPTPSDVTRAIGRRAAVIPSLLWFELGGEGDFTPLWLRGHLSKLGYRPNSDGAGFWWRDDLPRELEKRLVALFEELDDAYPDEDEEPC